MRDKKHSIKIDGITYDITNFWYHPGGQQMLKMAEKEIDATILFQTYHSNNAKVQQMLKTLPIIDNEYKQINTTLWNSVIYQELLTEVDKNITKNRTSHYCTYIWLISNAILFSCGYSALLLNHLLFSIMFLVSFNVHMGFTLYHFIHHGGMYKEWKTLMLFIEPFMNMSTYHGDDWKETHNVRHHINVNDPDIDEDIFSGLPLIRLHETQNKKWYHKYQHYYAFILYALYGVIVNWRNKMTLKKCFYPVLDILFYMIVPIMVNRNRIPTIVAYFVIKLLTGFTFVTIFSLSHNNIHLMIEREKKHTDWTISQITQSVNWGGSYSCFVFGGINYQIEHHLFPNIHPMYYPKISKIIRAYCAEHKISYLHYPFFIDAYNATQDYLKYIGNY